MKIVVVAFDGKKKKRIIWNRRWLFWESYEKHKYVHCAAKMQSQVNVIACVRLYLVNIDAFPPTAWHAEFHLYTVFITNSRFQ